MAGFPAVVQLLVTKEREFHLSASYGTRGFISVCLDADELEAWFSPGVAEKLKNLKEGQGVHCSLFPIIGKLTKKEREQIHEHDARNVIELSQCGVAEKTGP